MTASEDVKHVAVTHEADEGEQCRLPGFAQRTAKGGCPHIRLVSISTSD
jgi:hypothetical protein